MLTEMYAICVNMSILWGNVDISPTGESSKRMRNKYGIFPVLQEDLQALNIW